MPSKEYYDPVKAHEYYIRTRKLKGRKNGSSGAIAKGPRPPIKNVTNSKKAKSAKERVVRLKGKVAKLEKALAEVYAAMSKKRQDERKKAKENSDGKTTVKERQASKEYRDKHKEELKAKRKSSSKSGGSSSSSGPKSVEDMSLDELRTRATRLRTALDEAKRQLSNANQQLGQLAHSAIVEAPSINELFARYQSAERTPSK